MNSNEGTRIKRYIPITCDDWKEQHSQAPLTKKKWEIILDSNHGLYAETSESRTDEMKSNHIIPERNRKIKPNLQRAVPHQPEKKIYFFMNNGWWTPLAEIMVVSGRCTKDVVLFSDSHSTVSKYIYVHGVCVSVAHASSKSVGTPWVQVAIPVHLIDAIDSRSNRIFPWIFAFLVYTRRFFSYVFCLISGLCFQCTRAFAPFQNVSPKRLDRLSPYSSHT